MSDHRRSRHPRRQGGVARHRHRGERRHQGRRTSLAVGAADAMPPAQRDARRDGPARAARRDRRPCAFPRSRLSAQGGLRAAAPRRAAFGGVTTVFDMPNTIPPTGTGEALAEKHEMAAEAAHVDFGLYGLLGEDTIEHVPELRRRRRDRLQALHGQHLRQHSVALDRRDARSASRLWRRPASASRCMPRPTRSWSGARRACAAAGRIDPLAHLAARPAVVAVEAVSRAAILAEWTGARIHILHISLGRGAAPAARGQGARRRHHRRDLPALPAAVDRRLRALRRRHPRQSAGARGAQPGSRCGTRSPTAPST